MISKNSIIASFLQKLLRTGAALPRHFKILGLATLDILLLTSSLLLSFAIRFEPSTIQAGISQFDQGVGSWLVLHWVAIGLTGLYRPILRYAGPELVWLVCRGVLIGSGGFIILDWLVNTVLLPRSIVVMAPTFGLLSLIGLRLSIRWLIRIHLLGVPLLERRVVAIYGAGAAGIQLYESLQHQRNYQVKIFVDDDPTLQGRQLRGLAVHSPVDLAGLCESLDLHSIFLALPNATHERRKEILEQLRPLQIGVKVLPTMNQLLDGKGSYKALQEVQAADLLGRDEIAPDLSLLEKDIHGKTILVTGAGGSIGSELCREILRQHPKKLILLEQHEHALYQIERELRPQLMGTELVPCLSSILETTLVAKLLQQYQVETVYHAAAYKHVPLVEVNPLEGLRNNVLGTESLLEACQSHLPQSFVLVSTDKAVRPTNVMGSSKRMAELLVQDASRRWPECRWTMVRFGNVLDSSGSVIPLFREQLNSGKPLTGTHPEITRYFMSIGEAVRLVIQAGAMAQGGEVFLLDMGHPVKIAELARQMIELSGYVPERDVPIQFTGLRPGEKLYEELLIEPEQAEVTTHPRIFRSHEPLPETITIQAEIGVLKKAIAENDLETALGVMRRLVPEYGPVEQAQLLQVGPVLSQSVSSKLMN
ncbi:MAG: polysaccharide biosynthesis protein [bacterium]